MGTPIRYRADKFVEGSEFDVPSDSSQLPAALPRSLTLAYKNH
jgi:hypothetical protein